MNDDAVSHTFYCIMCDACPKQAALPAHIPQCYIEYCKGIGMKPLCTCDECGGKQTHPSGTYRPTPTHTHAVSTPHHHSTHHGVGSPYSTPSTSTQVTTPSPTPTPSFSTQPPAKKFKLSINQMKGKNCALCGNYKAPSTANVPWLC